MWHTENVPWYAMDETIPKITRRQYSQQVPGASCYNILPILPDFWIRGVCVRMARWGGRFTTLKPPEHTYAALPGK